MCLLVSVNEYPGVNVCVCVYEKGKLCACKGEGFVDCSVFVSLEVTAWIW